MMKHIANALSISEVEDKIKKIENVLSCGLAGFNTKTPSVRIFFEPTLEQEKKYQILSQVKEVMREYGLGDNEETRWCSVGFEVMYSR